jgi:S1-C subfamily serine protease
MTTAASSGGDVVGYAVPIAKVVKVASDLESQVANSRYDYALPAFLGVALGENSTTVQGVYQGTPAAVAGLSAGDSISAVDSTKVETAKQLHAAVARLSPGDRVALTWTDTDGASHTKTVTLATGPVE